jgi:hypothetical protein
MKLINLLFLLNLIKIDKLFACDCSCGVLELAILFDASPSINIKRLNFESALKEIREIICRFNIKHVTRFNFIHYGSNNPETGLHYEIKNKDDKKKVYNNLDRFIRDYDPEFVYNNDRSKASAAFRTLRRTAFRTLNHYGPKILIIFSDGLWNEAETPNYMTHINSLKTERVEIFVVKTSDQLNLNSLKAAVSLPINAHILNLKNMKKIIDIINGKTQVACMANAFTFYKDYNYDVCDELFYD